MRSLILLFVGLFSGSYAISQETEEIAVEIIEQSRPMYERFGMTSTQLFLLMTGLTILLTVVLWSLSANTNKIISFKAKNMGGKGTKAVALLLASLASGSTFAAEPFEQATMEIPFSDAHFWVILSFDVLLVLMIIYVSGIANNILYEFAKKRKARFWKGFQKRIVGETVLAEGSILLDHDYDGIKELDNNLPPWWKYGFYVTIVWAIGYFSYYTVLGGPSQEEEFITEVADGEREVAEYKAAHPELVTEESVQYLTDGATIDQGRNIFREYCVTCHMDGGSGGAGPNLTDDYWLYDNSIQGLFHTIYNGAENGMKSWKNELNGNQIQAVASYVLQLDPILPPQGQEPKGEYMPKE